MALLEALGCGCPVVVCGGDRAAPASFPPGSGVVGARSATGEAVADAVAALVADPAAWVREAEQARRTAAGEFSLDGQVERFRAAVAAWWPVPR
jgi:glycosyltransferase involved in cell wall biosynthesis